MFELEGYFGPPWPSGFYIRGKYNNINNSNCSKSDVLSPDLADNNCINEAKNENLNKANFEIDKMADRQNISVSLQNRKHFIDLTSNDDDDVDKTKRPTKKEHIDIDVDVIELLESPDQSRASLPKSKVMKSEHHNQLMNRTNTKKSVSSSSSSTSGNCNSTLNLCLPSSTNNRYMNYEGNTL